MVADLLPDFDYYQVEQSVNSERLQNRSNMQAEVVKQRATVVELPMSKNISAIIKAESQLMHRLLTRDNTSGTFGHQVAPNHRNSPHLAALINHTKLATLGYQR